MVPLKLDYSDLEFRTTWRVLKVGTLKLEAFMEVIRNSSWLWQDSEDVCACVRAQVMHILILGFLFDALSVYLDLLLFQNCWLFFSILFFVSVVGSTHLQLWILVFLKRFMIQAVSCCPLFSLWYRLLLVVFAKREETVRKSWTKCPTSKFSTSSSHLTWSQAGLREIMLKENGTNS